MLLEYVIIFTGEISGLRAGILYSGRQDVLPEKWSATGERSADRILFDSLEKRVWIIRSRWAVQ